MINAIIINSLANQYLCNWGNWANQGDESRKIGRLRSTLKVKKNVTDEIDEDLAVFVDGIIVMMPDISKNILRNVYLRKKSHHIVYKELLMSSSQYYAQLMALRWAIWACVAKKSLI